MTTKTTGIELKAFCNDPEFWPDGVIHEEEEIIVNGVDFLDMGDADINDIQDDDIVKISYGIVFKGDEYNKLGSFESYFKKWQKSKKIDILMVVCDKDKTEQVRAAIITAGGKVK